MSTPDDSRPRGARVEPGEDERREDDALIAGGVGIGALGVLTAVVGGAVCPVCVVAAPVLVGAGVFRKLRKRARRP
jgi:hypothetical protein